MSGHPGCSGDWCAVLQNDRIHEGVLPGLHRFVKTMQKGNSFRLGTSRPGWKGTFRRADGSARVMHITQPDAAEYLPRRRVVQIE